MNNPKPDNTPLGFSLKKILDSNIMLSNLSYNLSKVERLPTPQEFLTIKIDNNIEIFRVFIRSDFTLIDELKKLVFSNQKGLNPYLHYRISLDHIRHRFGGLSRRMIVEVYKEELEESGYSCTFEEDCIFPDFIVLRISIKKGGIND
jgi:hypothetical protein